MIVSDGLRLDLAHDLAELLDDDGCTLSYAFSTLPSNTPFGMTALLPLGDAPVGIDFAGGKARLTHDGGARLEERDGRKDLLGRKLADSKGKPIVGFVDLEQLLKDGRVPRTAVVVVFDQRIDEQGHKGTEELPGLVGKMVRNLKHGIDLLHNAGVGAVHVVTDHGFLFLPPDAVDALGAPQVPPTQYLYKHQRWTALRAGAQTTEVLRLPLPFSPDITLGFPRGVRTLEKAEQYLHGGISLKNASLPTSSRTGLCPKFGSDSSYRSLRTSSQAGQFPSFYGRGLRLDRRLLVNTSRCRYVSGLRRGTHPRALPRVQSSS